jgi:hypothetical protein
VDVGVDGTCSKTRAGNDRVNDTGVAVVLVLVLAASCMHKGSTTSL